MRKIRIKFNNPIWQRIAQMIVFCVMILIINAGVNYQRKDHSFYRTRYFAVATKSVKSNQETFYAGFPAPGMKAFILTNWKGKTLHHWSLGSHTPTPWYRGKIDPEGNLFALTQGKYLEKISLNSVLTWKTKGKFFHDFDLDTHGRTYLIEKKQKRIKVEKTKLKIINDFITILSPDGKRIKSISLYQIFSSFLPPSKLMTIDKHSQSASLFGLNSIKLINTNIPNIAKPGDLLINLEGIGLIAIIDPESERIRYHYYPSLNSFGQINSPRILNNGLLAFIDNKRHASRSEIVFYEPVLNKIEKKITSDNTEQFHTRTRGEILELRNGNLWITLSDTGQAQEITPAGQKFSSFKIIPKYKSLRNNVSEINRYPNDYFNQEVLNTIWKKNIKTK